MKSEHESNNRIHSEFDLNKLITVWRNSDDNLKLLNSKACQTVSKEVFGSYRSFFNLIKKDKSARPPRRIDEDNINTFHSISYNQSGWIFKNDKLYLNKIPLEYKYDSKIGDITELNIKNVILTFRNNKWILQIAVEYDSEYHKENVNKNNILSIDLGLSKLGTGVDNVGKVIVIPNKPKRINKYFNKQINKVKSKQSFTLKYSKRWFRLQKVKGKLYGKKNSQIKQALHIESKRLIDMNYKTIVVGDLTVKRLMNVNGVNKQKKGIRKSFHETNINMFLTFLKNKTIYTDIIKINESYTTQINCLTGKLFKETVDLSQREVWLSPNTLIDRDLNSAINIMKKYESQSLALVNEPLNVVQCIANNNLFQEATKSNV